MTCACDALPAQRAGEHGEDPLEPKDVEDAQGSIHRHAAPGPRLHAMSPGARNTRARVRFLQCAEHAQLQPHAAHAIWCTACMEHLAASVSALQAVMYYLHPHGQLLADQHCRGGSCLARRSYSRRHSIAPGCPGRLHPPRGRAGTRGPPGACPWRGPRAA